MNISTITIDFGAMAHVARRWLWRILGRTATETQCIDCGKELSQNEAYFYINTCERCEGILFAQFKDVA